MEECAGTEGPGQTGTAAVLPRAASALTQPEDLR